MFGVGAARARRWMLRNRQQLGFGMGGFSSAALSTLFGPPPAASNHFNQPAASNQPASHHAPQNTLYRDLPPKHRALASTTRFCEKC